MSAYRRCVLVVFLSLFFVLGAWPAFCGRGDIAFQTLMNGAVALLVGLTMPIFFLCIEMRFDRKFKLPYLFELVFLYSLVAALASLRMRVLGSLWVLLPPLGTDNTALFKEFYLHFFVMHILICLIGGMLVGTIMRPMLEYRDSLAEQRVRLTPRTD